MSEATPIRVPMDNVNDESVRLLSWQVKEGDTVQGGQLLAEVETSKAVVEMIAPLAGKVWLRAQAGSDVPVGAVVAFITTNGAPPPVVTEGHARAISSKIDAAAKPADSEAAIPSGTSFSKKALELLEQYRIPAVVFAGRGMVREQDIRQYMEESSSGTGDAENVHFALKGLDLTDVTLPRAFADTTSGRVDPKFLAELKANPDAIAKLASAEKIELYRKNGALIGDGVVLEPGTIIIAPQIILGDEAYFEENSSIICRERFCVGSLTSFCKNLHARGGTIVLGDNIWAGQDVRIGGGGHADPWSILCIGDDSYLGDNVYLNICRPVMIGRNVFMTLRSIIMTHNVGHSILDGYENRFAPVILGDFSQIGMNSTIYAGSQIGRSAIVVSNSYVISAIPAGKLAMGVPAKVVRNAARQLDRPKQVQLVQTMMREFRELLRLKGHSVSELETSPFYQFSLEREGKRFQLSFVENFPTPGFSAVDADESVVWTLESPSGAAPEGVTLMNLLAKEIAGPTGVFSNSAREFLRKRGIRCKPGPWRYRQGLI